MITIITAIGIVLLFGGVLLVINLRKPRRVQSLRVDPPSTATSHEQLLGRLNRVKASAPVKRREDHRYDQRDTVPAPDDGLASNLVMFAAIESISTQDPSPSYSAPDPTPSYDSGSSYGGDSYGGSSYDSGGSSYDGGSSSGGGSGSDW